MIKTTTDFTALRRGALEILQVNLGYKCNQSCVHCHVNAGPSRTEVMTPDTLDAVLQALDHLAIGVLDVTGGAPEMHPQFRELVLAATRLGVRVIDRCNLTILSEPGYEDLGAFLAEHEIEVVASLPCYLEDNVDRQRGKSVFQQSIAGLRQLNALGYGHPGSERVLNLVYNPQGPVLPPAQVELEAQYREVLQREYGIAFHHLLTLANMPIARFGATLLAKGEFDAYLALLRHSYNAKTLPGLMCRHTLSVDWQGYVYDCDFNQMLNVPLGAAAGESVHLSALAELVLTGQPIAVADHCFGCTAGQGSSCGGALT
ncbi:MAG: arsenosugar biosynthesis radical SAM protein ArsS [Gammaproteobacteria bacterium]